MRRSRDAAGAEADFFVSHAGADRAWAEWVAWHLEDAGYRTVVQAWDFGAGAHFVGEMHRAAERTRRTVAVLSRAYAASVFTAEEWQAAWAADPGGRGGRLLAVRVEDCDRPGLLRQLVCVDLFGVDQETARERLLAAAGGGSPPWNRDSPHPRGCGPAGRPGRRSPVCRPCGTSRGGWPRSPGAPPCSAASRRP
jgi:hypothetical protein